jgi:hypothetical protein
MLTARLQRTLILPTRKRITNWGGSPFSLTPGDLDDMLTAGSRLDARQFGDSVLPVGHVYFHPGSRDSAVPPFAEVEAFVEANPRAPVVVDKRVPDQPAEFPHLVLASFVINDQRALQFRGGRPVLNLFTVAAGHDGKAFDPASHFKDGKQHTGVQIHDWSMVNFDSPFQHSNICETFRLVYSCVLGHSFSAAAGPATPAPVAAHDDDEEDLGRFLEDLVAKQGYASG